MKNKIKVILSRMLSLILCLSIIFGCRLPVYASGGEEETEKKQLIINGVDFSNLDLENFKLSDLSADQLLVIMDIIDMYGLDSGEWSFADGSFSQWEEEEETTSLFSDYELTGEEPTRAEKKGTGSSGTAIVTSNDLQGAMEFVKITTKDDQMFYLVIDYTKDTDNVYFLDIVSVNDLFRIAENETDADENPIYIDYSQFKDKAESNGEKTTEATKEARTEQESESAPEASEDKKTIKDNNMMQNFILIIGIALIGGVAFVVLYFIKVKNKKIDEDDDSFDDMFDDDEEESEEDLFGTEGGDESPFDMELADEPESIPAENETDELVDIDAMNGSNFTEDDETDNSDF